MHHERKYVKKKIQKAKGSNSRSQHNYLPTIKLKFIRVNYLKSSIICCKDNGNFYQTKSKKNIICFLVQVFLILHINGNIPSNKD